MENVFKGTGPALITPFKKTDQSVDFDALGNFIEFQIGNGVDFLVALGTTAESATMSHQERHDVYRFIREKNNGRLPLMVGMGGNNTKEVIEHIKSADLEGVQGLLSVVPYYNKPTQEGLYRHFMALAEASPLPILLYNVPSRCGVNMLAETTLRLFHASEKFLGIKEASGNLDQIKEIIEKAPANRVILSGDDSLIYDVCSSGGHGVISVMANALPAETAKLTRLALANDFDAKAVQDSMAEFIQLLFVEGNPAGVKAFLHQIGMIDNELRLPLVSVSQKTYDAIYRISKELH